MRSPIAGLFPHHFIPFSQGAAGFNKIASGTTTLLISCTMPARRSAFRYSSGSSKLSPRRADISGKPLAGLARVRIAPFDAVSEGKNRPSAFSSSSLSCWRRNSERVGAMSSLQSTGLLRKSAAPTLMPRMRSSVSEKTRDENSRGEAGFRRRFHAATNVEAMHAIEQNEVRVKCSAKRESSRPNHLLRLLRSLRGAEASRVRFGPRFHRLQRGFFLPFSRFRVERREMKIGNDPEH
jgi:hypothetical protein